MLKVGVILLESKVTITHDFTSRVLAMLICFLHRCMLLTHISQTVVVLLVNNPVLHCHRCRKTPSG